MFLVKPSQIIHIILVHFRVLATLSAPEFPSVCDGFGSVILLVRIVTNMSNEAWHL